MLAKKTEIKKPKSIIILENVLLYNFYLQESRVSTVWCEGQVLSMNGTFNAYLLKERPKLKRWKHGQHVTMNR